MITPPAENTVTATLEQAWAADGELRQLLRDRADGPCPGRARDGPEHVLIAALHCEAA